MGRTRALRCFSLILTAISLQVTHTSAVPRTMSSWSTHPYHQLVTVYAPYGAGQYATMRSEARGHIPGAASYGAAPTPVPLHHPGLYFTLPPAASMHSLPSHSLHAPRAILPDRRDLNEVQALREEVERLRLSHATTSREMMVLSDAVRASSRVVTGLEQGSIFDPQHARRATLFLSPLFATFLKSARSSFGVPRCLTGPASTIQVLSLSSRSTDCTLLEAMALAARFDNDSSLRCFGDPDFYAIRFADARSVAELRVNF